MGTLVLLQLRMPRLNSLPMLLDSQLQLLAQFGLELNQADRGRPHTTPHTALHLRQLPLHCRQPDGPTVVARRRLHGFDPLLQCCNFATASGRLQHLHVLRKRQDFLRKLRAASHHIATRRTGPAPRRRRPNHHLVPRRQTLQARDCNNRLALCSRLGQNKLHIRQRQLKPNLRKHFADCRRIRNHNFLARLDQLVLHHQQRQAARFTCNLNRRSCRRRRHRRRRRLFLFRCGRRHHLLHLNGLGTLFFLQLSVSLLHRFVA